MKECEIYKKILTLSELEALIREAEEEAEAIRGELKEYMTEHGTAELKAGKYRARYTEVTSSRFDSAAFKKAYADLYAKFTHKTVTHRFTVA
jgi:predicted phage-related endonuclease